MQFAGDQLLPGAASPGPYEHTYGRPALPGSRWRTLDQNEATQTPRRQKSDLARKPHLGPTCFYGRFPESWFAATYPYVSAAPIVDPPPGYPAPIAAPELAPTFDTTSGLPRGGHGHELIPLPA